MTVSVPSRPPTGTRPVLPQRQLLRSEFVISVPGVTIDICLDGEDIADAISNSVRRFVLAAIVFLLGCSTAVYNAGHRSKTELAELFEKLRLDAAGVGMVLGSFISNQYSVRVKAPVSRLKLVISEGYEYYLNVVLKILSYESPPLDKE
jgi:hypothetical protein